MRKSDDTGRWISLLLLMLLSSTAANAQQSGGTANSAVGQAGQRETRDQPPTGILPMARIDSRIQNRIRSRIRNRIDRNYVPQANATSPFEVAGEQARVAGQPRSR